MLQHILIPSVSVQQQFTVVREDTYVEARNTRNNFASGIFSNYHLKLEKKIKSRALLVSFHLYGCTLVDFSHRLESLN